MKRMKPNTMMVRQLLSGGKEGPWIGVDTRTMHIRNRWWTKARVPGTVRASRLPGGSGFRNNWEGTLP